MSEVIARAITPVGPLQKFLDALTPIVVEAKLHFNDDGIHARAVDPANVAMTFPELDASVFESYESPGEAVVGANLETLEERLSVANSGDLVELALDMETRKLTLDIRNTHQTVALIDQEAIRDEPDLPDLDLPNTVTIEGRDYKEAIEVVGYVSDHTYFNCDLEEEQLRVVAEGDTDESVVTFGRDELVDGKIMDSTESLYSHGYLTDLAGPIPKTTEVEIDLGDEFPIRYKWTGADGNLDVMTLIAPRIQND